MIYGCLEKAILSVIHCIIHLWVFFPCAPVGNNGAFVDQKITESAATSNRKRKKRRRKRLAHKGKAELTNNCTNRRGSVWDERRERGGLVVAVREAIRRPHFRLHG